MEQTVIRKHKKWGITKEVWVAECTTLHGGKYDYSRVKWPKTNWKMNMCHIVCPIHGEFVQRSYRHLSGKGCPRCGKTLRSGRKRLTTEKFIKKARAVHGEKYDYHLVRYKDSHTHVQLICNGCGRTFMQAPYYHTGLPHGHGCVCYWTQERERRKNDRH